MLKCKMNFHISDRNIFQKFATNQAFKTGMFVCFDISLNSTFLDHKAESMVNIIISHMSSENMPF